MHLFARLVASTFFLAASLPAEPPATVASPSGDVTIVSSDRSPPLGEPVLALAWLDDTRLAVLSPGSVSVHRLERSRLFRIARHELPSPLAVVRHPGGLILAGDDAFWVLTSGMARAVLYAQEGERLAERAQAEALPWPGAPGGLRYREGTNLLESSAGLLLTPVVEGLAVDAEGRLLLFPPPFGSPADRSSLPGLRAGSALTALGDGRVAASSAAPPVSPDGIQVLARRGDELQPRGSIPVPGSVCALAARRRATEVRLAAAVETASGDTVVLVLGLLAHGP